jgi:FKBP-type peptidyl-prolyl cis-trans isomerase FkpA
VKKSSSSPAVSASLRFWRTVAILAVCVVAGLVFGILKELRVPGETPEPVAAAEPATPPAQPELKGPFAALGSHIAQNNRIAELGWSAEQFQEFLDGIRAAYEGRGLPLDEEARKLRDEIDQRAPSQPGTDEPHVVEDYFRSLRENEGVLRSESGLHYRITEEETGPRPTPDAVVVISFSVQQRDGEERPELNRSQLRTRVSELPPGLAEGVQLLSVGGKALLYLPAEHSLKPAEGSPAVPTTMPLVVSMELHEIAQPASR